MVHTFNFDDNYYIYDSEASSLLKCDRETAEAVERLKRLPGAEPEKGLEEIYEEIASLKKEGLLFKEEERQDLKKSDTLKALCLHICHDCNLKCAYCFASEGTFKGERQFMSFETAKRAIDFLIANSGDRKILETDFFGGEPLMNIETVKKTVAYAREQGDKLGKKFLFTLTTNGVLLNDENVKFLNEEMENVVLSLDGRKEVHDAVRKTVNGKGSFDVVIDHIKNFVKSRGDKSYYVRGTYTSKNKDFSKDVLFLADSGFDQISLEPVVLEGGSDLALRREDLPQIREEYKNLAREYLKRYKEGNPFNFFHFNIDIEGGPCLAKRLNACGAGNEYLSVTPNGDIYPCHQFADNPEYLMGNVYEGKIDEQIRAIFKNSSLYTREKCGDCFARYHCSGGCAANNVNFNGDINKPYEITCEMMKARTECAMHILSEKKEREENDEK